MSKVLDLDAILPPERILKFQGKEYQLKTLSLKDFISMSRRTEEIRRQAAEKKNVTVVDVIQMQIEAVQFAIPDMPREVLEMLSYEQLDKILAFARENAEQGKPEEPAHSAGSAEGKA